MNFDTCYLGDVRDGLRAIAAAGIRPRTCITSPPYWGLRDYGTAQWDGGNPQCDHRQHLGGNVAASNKQTTSGGTQSYQYRDACAKCGARRFDRQFGLEPTINEYVANMVEVFRLVRDVLADDGTLWLNLGDSYNTQAGAVGSRPGGGGQGDKWAQIGAMTSPSRMPQGGLKPKDLCGIPWRVAFALQDDGWWLRQDIIWHKPNPMPESIRDRCTKAHEYLFLLSKRERYYYDFDAVREPVTEPERRYKTPDGWDTSAGKGGHGSYHREGREAGFVGYVSKSGNKARKPASARGVPVDDGGRTDGAVAGSVPWEGSHRNRRSVWTIATEAFPDAHFATFPTALVEPCILAGSAPGDVVLDPFMGSGTVAQVAQALGRHWVGCELNPEYHAMQAKRTAQQGLALA